MSRMATLVSLLLLLVALGGCSSGMRVQQDWDDTIEFAKFKTFRVMEIRGVADELVARRLINAVETHMIDRGWEVDAENPDMVVAIHTSVADRVDVQSWGYSASSRHWHSGRDITVRQYQEGTLAIDLVESANMQLFWRGWGSQSLGSSSRSQEVIQDAVDRILNQFPPN